MRNRILSLLLALVLLLSLAGPFETGAAAAEDAAQPAQAPVLASEGAPAAKKASLPAGAAQRRTIPSDAVELVLDQESDETIQDSEGLWFRFTPAVTDVYRFVSTNTEVDSHVYLYAPEGELLGDDDDSGEDYCFRIEYLLEAGKTYGLKVICHQELPCAVKVLASTAHDPEWSYDPEPSCTEPGFRRGLCRYCGADCEENVPALGHDYEWTYDPEPTCTEPGRRTGVCTRCGATETEDVDAIGHWFTAVEWQDPTCTEDGWTRMVCERCGLEELEVEPARHNVSWDVDLPWLREGDCLDCGQHVVEAAELTPIALGESKAVDITKPGEEIFFSFTPTGNDIYRFWSKGSFDTFGAVYSEDGALLYENDDYQNVDFRVELELSADSTYYFMARMLDSNLTGSFQVYLEQVHDWEQQADSRPWKEHRVCTLCGKEERQSWPVEPIEEGKVKEAAILKQGAKAFFSFTPATEHPYYVDSFYRGADYLVDIYDAEGGLVDVYAGPLQAGKTYYVGTHFLGANTTGYIPVELAPDHDWEYTVLEEATCTEAGRQSMKCRYCSEERVEEYGPLGHDYNTQSSQAPTCTEPGWAIEVCSLCGAEERIELPAEHQYEDETTLPWYSLQVCQVCGDRVEKTWPVESIALDRQKTVKIEKKGDQYFFRYTPDQDEVYTLRLQSNAYLYAACYGEEGRYVDSTAGDREINMVCNLSRGRSYYFRVQFDSTYQTGSIQATLSKTHDYRWNPDVQPTCTKPGHGEAVCAYCGEKISGEIPALGHDYELAETFTGNCTKQGYRLYRCVRCGDSYTETLPAEHYMDWVFEKPWHLTETCRICGHSEERSWPVEPIALGEIKTVKMQEYSDRSIFSFTPAVTDTYVFSSSGVHGFAWGGCYLEENDTYLDWEFRETDDMGDFRCGFRLEAGKTYYLIPWTDLWELPTEFTVTLEQPGNWGKPSYTWSKDNGSVTATRTDKDDSSRVQTETVKTSSKVTRKPTTEREGEMVYTAVFKNSAFKTQTKTVAIPKLEVTKEFDDVKNKKSFYYTPVYWAVSKGITTGTSATTFEPNKTCTRAEVVTFLYRAAGSPKVDTSTPLPFTDVPANAFYAKAVRWAVANKITTGTSATTFEPNKTCTRGEVVTFLHRAAGKPSAPADNSFTDVPSGAFYAKAVAWAVKNKITAGKGNGLFAPLDTCTRGEVVTFLYRAEN